jgi:ribosome biogenesis GTPase A
MFSKIYPKSIVLLVCDMSNFEGSVVQEVLQEVEKKHLKLILVCNKIDALPTNFKVERLERWV